MSSSNKQKEQSVNLIGWRVRVFTDDAEGVADVLPSFIRMKFA
jgi:hypothetical protein